MSENERKGIKAEIRLISGCMKSGKSARLIEIYREAVYEGKNVEILQPYLNTRDLGFLRSRKYTNYMVRATRVSNLELLYKNDADITLVDEAQMLDTKELKRAVKKWIEKNRKLNDKALVLACLDLNAAGELFKNYSLLRKYCTVEEYRVANCDEVGCNRIATRTTLYLSREKGRGRGRNPEFIIEGDGAMYKAHCVNHWQGIMEI